MFGASGLLGFLVTLWRMLKRAKQAKVQPDAESGRGSNTASAAAAAAPQAATNGGAAAPQAAATSGAAATGNATLVLARTVRLQYTTQLSLHCGAQHVICKAQQHLSPDLSW